MLFSLDAEAILYGQVVEAKINSATTSPKHQNDNKGGIMSRCET
jgi:hypothetical protein